MDEQIAISIELDTDGFVRRACPTCEYEFKWLYTDDDESESSEPDDRGFFCPYCGVQAQPDQWFTKAQVAYIQQAGLSHAADQLDKTFSRMNRAGSSLKSTRSNGPMASAQSLPEPDDMRRVDFDCHSKHPLKIVEDWAGPVQCVICGATA
jgi:hypothetical protein